MPPELADLKISKNRILNQQKKQFQNTPENEHVLDLLLLSIKMMLQRC
jgi:hypothetical protein